MKVTAIPVLLRKGGLIPKFGHPPGAPVQLQNRASLRTPGLAED